jgi:hypothetical protein
MNILAEHRIFRQFLFMCSKMEMNFQRFIAYNCFLNDFPMYFMALTLP